jgi:hypothetical protein
MERYSKVVHKIKDEKRSFKYVQNNSCLDIVHLPNPPQDIVPQGMFLSLSVAVQPGTVQNVEYHMKCGKMQTEGGIADMEKKEILDHRLILKVFVILICVVAMTASLHGPAYSGEGAAMKGSQLWPQETDGWKITEGPADYGPTTAYTYMNGAAELFNAYNMKKLTVLRYGKAKRPDIILEIYEMASSADASGLFSFESDDPGADIGQGSEFGGGLLRFWKGRYFVSVYGDGQGAHL